MDGNAERDSARQHAAEAVEAQLQDFAANLFRVVRGAGKPHEIGEQAARLVEAYEDFQSAVGRNPSPELITGAFADDERRPRDAEGLLREHGERMIIFGALQILASRLVGQRTQESAGYSQMYDGIRHLGEANAEMRRKWEAEAQAKRRTARSSKKRGKAGPADLKNGRS